MQVSNHELKALMLDTATGFYRMQRYRVGDFFGPVDLGIHLAFKHNALTIGAGLLAGSVFPGSNRLIFAGISPCWHGFYVSSMGGAALVFDNLGINMLSLVGKAPHPSLLYLNRYHGEEIEVELIQVVPEQIWESGRQGVYAVMEHAIQRFGPRYKTDPRVLAIGPASRDSDFGAIGSAPVKKGQLTHVDTWAGRGRLRQQDVSGAWPCGHHLRRNPYRRGFSRSLRGGSMVRGQIQPTDGSQGHGGHHQVPLRSEIQYGSTFGVNYAAMDGDILAFNYRTIYWSHEARKDLHERFILNHYLKQFNEETIQTKQQRTCGEPCAAVCKKMHGKYKKDYEPYQSMGPLCGIFDQRAAEQLNHHADRLGFDAISVGGILAWLMDCLDDGLIAPAALGVTQKPRWEMATFDVVGDSMHNAELGMALLNQMITPGGKIALQFGVRKFARRLSREKGRQVLDRFVYNAFARQGWMVPNQYWTPGVFAPMAITGKYYMYYGRDFLPPRELGRENARRMLKELMLDNLGFCRFHRTWAETLLPDIVENLFGEKDAFLRSITLTASRITSRNASVFWESERNMDMVFEFLKNKKQIDGVSHPELDRWIAFFTRDKHAAAYEFWYDMHKGIHEMLREYPV